MYRPMLRKVNAGSSNFSLKLNNPISDLKYYPISTVCFSGNHGTFNTALAAVVPAVAMMDVEPVATAVAKPETEIVATVGLPDDQIFILEISTVPFEQVAVAVKVCVTVAARVADAGEILMAVKFPLLTMNTALAPIPFPVQTFTVALPGWIPRTWPFMALAMATSLVAGSISQYTPFVTSIVVLSEYFPVAMY
jgi:hypothetical protein